MINLKHTTVALLAAGLIVPSLRADVPVAKSHQTFSIEAIEVSPALPPDAKQPSDSEPPTEAAKQHSFAQPTKAIPTPIAAPTPIDQQVQQTPARPHGQTDALKQLDSSKTEVVRTRYPNRNVKIVRHVTQDSKRNYFNHGGWTMWSPEGEIVGTGEYRGGKRQGKWLRLFVGEDASRLLDDRQQDFLTPLLSKASFVDGKVHGTWLIVDAQNRKVRSWQFDHGTLHGETAAWYASGARLREGHYDHSAPSGEHREWSADGKMTERFAFRDSQRIDPYVKRFESGKVQIQGHYLLSRVTLDTQVDWWNGAVNIDVNEESGEDIKHGRWVHYYESGGKAFEGDYADNRPQGTHIWWYDNGQKRIEGSFKAGIPHGQWVWWHENGLKRTEGTYYRGLQNDTWVHWSPEGKVAHLQEYASHGPGEQPAVPEAHAEQPEQSEAVPSTADRSAAPALPLDLNSTRRR